MRNECPICESLWQRYRESVQRHDDATARLDRESHAGQPDRLRSAQERLKSTEHERVQVRSEIMIHEKSAHPASESSFD